MIDYIEKKGKEKECLSLITYPLEDSPMPTILLKKGFILSAEYYNTYFKIIKDIDNLRGGGKRRSRKRNKKRNKKGNKNKSKKIRKRF